MKVSIEQRKTAGGEFTEITFKLIDLKTEKDFDDLDHIVYGCTSAYCFEAMERVSPEYGDFLKSLKLQNTYAIQAGILNDRPFFAYGKKAKSPSSNALIG
jgi:hypothetical protein